MVPLSPTNDDVQRRAYLLAAGSNSDGQLGIGHGEDAHRLRRCVGLQSTGESDVDFPPQGSRVVQLASGAGHAVAIVERSNGTRQVWASGTGAEGQLGPAYVGAHKSVVFAQLDCESLLLAVNVAHDAASVSRWRPKHAVCGWNWTLLSFEDSESTQDDILLVLGSTNDFGQLGRGIDRKHVVPVARLQFVSDEGSLRMRIEGLACGMRHSLVLCSYSVRSTQASSWNVQRYELFGWGAARYGQLGNATEHTSSITSDAALRPAGKATAVVWAPRHIQSWSRAAICDEACQSFLMSTGKEHSALWVPQGWQCEAGGLVDDACTQGRLLVFGSNRLGQTDLQRNATFSRARMLSVDCTWSGTLAFCADDDISTGWHRLTVQGSGSNAKGQMGSVAQNDETHKAPSWLVAADSTDTTQARLTCGSEHVLVLLPWTATEHNANARVLGWGWNEHGNLAQGDEVDRFEPVQLWPPSQQTGQIQGDLPYQATPTHIWAGCGTTYIQVML